MSILLRASRPWLLSRSTLQAYTRSLDFATTRCCYSVDTNAANTARTGASRTKPSKDKPIRLKNRLTKFPAATIIPHSVYQDDDTLLSHVKAPPIRFKADKQRFCLVLATPAFASRLSNPSFVAKLLDRMHRRTSPQLRQVVGMRLDALCAVVDKLPMSNSPSPSTPTLTPNAAGYEGIAYVSLPPMCSVPSPSPSATGAIDFIFPKPTSYDNPVIQRLRLPLANTIFHTGSPTTMFLHVYTNPGPDQSNLRLESTTPLAHHQVRINPYPPGAYIHSEMEPELTIPLVPLTEQRQVKASMGNIIRRIIGPDAREVTASLELEEAVPRFFKVREEDSQATKVWALVIPSRSEALMQSLTREYLRQTTSEGSSTQWETMWRQESHTFAHILRTALRGGARLHRVLSGGGGWGQKAGLISLDPVPPIDFVTSSITEHPKSAPTDPTDFASTLTPVANEGDFIQFFVQPTSRLTPKDFQNDAKSHIKNFSGMHALGWELGTIPSSIDSIPGQSWQHDSSTTKDGSTVTRRFGALAEGPLQLTQYTLNNSIKQTTTTIDVPFTRLIYRCGMPTLAHEGKKRNSKKKRVVDMKHTADNKDNKRTSKSQNLATVGTSRSNVATSHANFSSVGRLTRHYSTASSVQTLRSGQRPTLSTLVVRRTYHTKKKGLWLRKPHKKQHNPRIIQHVLDERQVVGKRVKFEHAFETARIVERGDQTPKAELDVSSGPINFISSTVEVPAMFPTDPDYKKKIFEKLEKRDVHSALHRIRDGRVRFVLTDHKPREELPKRERRQYNLDSSPTYKHIKTKHRKAGREIIKLANEHGSIMQCLADQGYAIPYLAPPAYLLPKDVHSLEVRCDSITHQFMALVTQYKAVASQLSFPSLNTLAVQPRDPNTPPRVPLSIRRIVSRIPDMSAAYATHLLVHITATNRRLASITYGILTTIYNRVLTSPRSRRRKCKQLRYALLPSRVRMRVRVPERLRGSTRFLVRRYACAGHKSVRVWTMRRVMMLKGMEGWRRLRVRRVRVGGMVVRRYLSSRPKKRSRNTGSGTLWEAIPRNELKRGRGKRRKGIKKASDDAGWKELQELTRSWIF